MTLHRLRWPTTATVSLLAGLTTWVALLTWSGFSERSSGFLVPLFGGCLLVAVVGTALRSARMHPAVVVLAQLVVLLLWVNHMWAGGHAIAGWLPTRASLLEVGDALGHSVAVSQNYAAPVPAGQAGLFPALILAGAGAALLVDFLACGLRRVPLAGLPLLAVYTAPLSILDHGVSWAKFAVGALCFLLLIAAEESRRLAHWGRQLSSGVVFDSQASTVSGQAVRASARKIGLTATGLAVVVPLLVPTFGAGLLARSGNGPGNGDGSVSLSNPMVSLRRDLIQGRDENLLYVTTPDPAPSYLRIAVLDHFDGDAWLPGGRAIPIQQRTEGPVPPPPGLDPDVPRTQVPYRIEVTQSFASSWLPTPYPAVSWIKAAGDWRYDTSTMDFISAATDQTTAGLTYQLRAVRPDYNPRRMVNAAPAPVDLLTKYTKLPDNLPPSVTRLARRVTANQTNDFARAVRLQQWFHDDGGFTYSLSRAPGDSMQQLVKFLGTGPGSRVGYCQQFAAAMALMGRALQIPSRVAVGFLRPSQVGPDTWVYSSHDLHAWPEMYFEGTGWVRFEPTPAPRVSAVPGYTLAPLAGIGDFHHPAQAPTVPSQNRIDQQKGVPTGPHTTESSSTHADHGGLPLTTILVVLAVLLLLAGPRLVRQGRRHRRWASVTTPSALAETAWAELRDTALDLRLAWDDTVTPRVRARDVAAHFGASDDGGRVSGRPLHGPLAAPEAAEALDRLVLLVERARFSRPRPATAQLPRDLVDEVTSDVAVCGQALGNGTGRGRRMLARWLPMSLVRWTGRRTTQPAVVTGVGVDHAT